MTTSALAQLTLWGSPRPRPLETWSASARAIASLLSPDVVELCSAWGPGRLAAVFSIPDPTGDDWSEWRARAVAWYERGHWAGLARAEVERLAIFARDRRGAGLAYGPEGYVHLGARGEVFRAGRTFEELVQAYLCRSFELTEDLRISNEHEQRIELGVEATYVSASAPGLADYLEASRLGRDEHLEAALNAEPLTRAYERTIAALCSSSSDAIADDVREEALDTVLALAKRRVPLLVGLSVPKSVLGPRPFADEAVRAWAQVAAAPAEGGPLFEMPPPGVDFDVPPELRRGESAGSRDPIAWAEAVVARWRGTPLESHADAMSGEVRSMPPGLAFGVLRQIEQLDGYRTHLRSGAGGVLSYDRPEERADAAESRLASFIPDAWPLVALAVMSDQEAVCIRATRLLRGLRSDMLFDFWLRLVVATAPPMPWGADLHTFAEAAVAAGAVSDALVERLLPALRRASPIAAILLSSRVDRDDVVSVLTERYVDVALASAWSPRPHTRQHLGGDDLFAVEALSAHFGLDAPPRRSLCEPSPRDEGERRCVPTPYFSENGLYTLARPSVAQALTPPHRAGPLGPVTRALTTRREKAVVEMLRKVARNPRLPIDTRDEAAKGLVESGAPGAEEIATLVERAWERYVRI